MLNALLVATAILSSSSYAAEVTCEAWYQEADGKLETGPLPKIEASDRGATYKGNFHGHEYNAIWAKGLTTYYISIDNVLNVTARVPTDDHPETFAQVKLPKGPMLAVNCSMPGGR